MLNKRIFAVFLIAASATLGWGESGASLYKKTCAGCHGKHGERPAVGVSAVIQGQNPALTIKQLKGYREGMLNQHGMGNLMNKYTKRLSDKHIRLLAEYISSLR